MMPRSQIHAGHLHVQMCALAVHEEVTTGCPTTAGHELSEAQRAGSDPERFSVGRKGLQCVGANPVRLQSTLSNSIQSTGGRPPSG